jgi:glycosyltransferase involved in cell wall biosynthesis
MPTAAFVSFRLGLPDGVSVTAATWMRAFTELGYGVRAIGGEGDVDVCLPWLGIDGGHRPVAGSPDPDSFARAIVGATVVVVENALTIPMNLPASRALADSLRGVPTLVHHYDPPWQRARFAHVTALPIDDPAWRHVTINHLTERQLAERGIRATTIYSGFDLDPHPGDRAGTRARLGIDADEKLLLHPVRAIERKDVPRALALAEAVGATYWLTGPAEEGYGPTLDRVLAGAKTRVRREPMVGPGGDVRQQQADAYAACDAVLFPSTWEGFGNPPIEAAAHRKPAVVGHYPVAEELRGLGFQWVDPDDPAALAAALARPDEASLTRNLAVARAHFSHEAMRSRIGEVLAEPGWLDGAAPHRAPLAGSRP